MHLDDAVTKRSTLLISAVSSFLMPAMASSVNIALPSIGRDFGMDAVLLGWITTAYLLAAAMFLVPAGRMADILGRKKVFLWGTVIYTLVSLLLAVSPSGGFLIACRCLQGIGGSMTFGTSMAILTSVYPPGERGKAIGITTAAVYLGLSLGPFLGGLLTQQLGWRSIFYLNVPVGLFILALTVRKLKGEWADARGEKLDLTGSFLYGLTLLGVIYGFSSLPHLAGGLLILMGLAGIFLFVKWETRADSPLLDIKLLRGNTAFIFSNLAALINYSATFAVTFLLSLYLQYIKGLTPQNAGLILVAQPAVMTVFALISGHLSDRIEPQVVASVGMALTTIGLVLLVFLGPDTPLTLIVIALVILGSGFGLFSSPNTNAVMSSVEKKSYGLASAVLGTMRLVGQTFSMGIAMLIFAVVIGRVKISPDSYPLFLQSVRLAFILFAVLCAAGVAASLARGKIRPAG
ncbi:MFS transporter [candidate division KSB1 bacterium]|nr:MAG: MFS transporter [candidate division KSB1 bacterium]